MSSPELISDEEQVEPHERVAHEMAREVLAMAETDGVLTTTFDCTVGVVDFRNPSAVRYIN